MSTRILWKILIETDEHYVDLPTFVSNKPVTDGVIREYIKTFVSGNKDLNVPANYVESIVFIGVSDDVPYPIIEGLSSDLFWPYPSVYAMTDEDMENYYKIRAPKNGGEK